MVLVRPASDGIEQNGSRSTSPGSTGRDRSEVDDAHGLRLEAEQLDGAVAQALITIAIGARRRCQARRNARWAGEQLRQIEVLEIE